MNDNYIKIKFDCQDTNIIYSTNCDLMDSNKNWSFHYFEMGKIYDMINALDKYTRDNLKNVPLESLQKLIDEAIDLCRQS